MYAMHCIVYIQQSTADQSTNFDLQEDLLEGLRSFLEHFLHTKGIFSIQIKIDA